MRAPLAGLLAPVELAALACSTAARRTWPLVTLALASSCEAKLLKVMVGPAM
jgi:hypothetical protein